MSDPISCEAVFFDLFDTLIHIDYEGFPRVTFAGQERPSTAGRLRDFLAGKGHDIPLDRFLNELIAVYLDIQKEKAAEHREIAAITRHERLLARLGINAGPELAGEMTELHMGYLVRHARPAERATELLEAYAAKVPVALISNFDHTSAGHAILEKFGWTARFRSIVISDALGLCKPRRELYDMAVRETGVPHEKAVMVGDTHLADVKGSKDLGLRAIWINLKNLELAPEQVQPDQTIRALKELPDVLKV